MPGRFCALAFLIVHLALGGCEGFIACPNHCNRRADDDSEGNRHAAVVPASSTAASIVEKTADDRDENGDDVDADEEGDDDDVCEDGEKPAKKAPNTDKSRWRSLVYDDEAKKVMHQASDR